MTDGARIIVLGSAAGGGSPQWNCRCSICQSVRRAKPGAPRRTQTSLALSADGRRWALINASPDLGEQLHHTPELHPQRDGRHSPVEAVVLTGAEVDQVAGLLTMREREPFALYASRTTHGTLNESPIFEALDPEIVARRTMPTNEPVELCDAHHQPLGISVISFPVPGKVPLYMEEPGRRPAIGEATEANVALEIQIADRKFYFIPGCAEITDSLKSRLRGANLLFFDGTLWRDDELIAADLGHKTGHRMGHVSINDPDGPLAQLSDLDIGQKIFIHMNNSNPVLLADSSQRERVEHASWEVAHDGMEIDLS